MRGGIQRPLSDRNKRRVSKFVMLPMSRYLGGRLTLESKLRHRDLARYRPVGVNGVHKSDIRSLNDGEIHC